MGLVMPAGESAPTGVCTCGAPLPENAAYCANCGRAVRPVCGLCNTVFKEKAEFCTSCGAPRSFARPLQCPNCSIRLMGGGNFCTGCGQLLYKLCNNCGSRQMPGWLHCPLCNQPAESQGAPHGFSPEELPPTAIPAIGGDSPQALAEILNQEGATAFERNQLQDAEQLFRRASQLDAEEPLYLTNLAAVLGEMGREEEADQTLRYALQMDPEDPSTLLACGNFAADRGRADEAAGYWRKLIEVAPESEEAAEAQENLDDLQP
ncbi:MAG: hypothetical protein KY468_00585 [Armatimonadetes bacterium]|nr:hypothetical protein [Armatimonadota bacterium]